MTTAVLAIHVIVAMLIILFVLIQGGENVDITAAFGGVSQAAFGPRGTVSTLARITWVLGALFVATSITLSVWATRHRTGSVLEGTPTHAVPTKPAPTTPAPPPKK